MKGFCLEDYKILTIIGQFLLYIIFIKLYDRVSFD